MGLNLSNAQIGQELGLDVDSAHDMATQLRKGILAREPAVVLSGEVECDGVYIVAGHKGNPEAVKKGEVVIQMLANVQQVTIEPLMRASIAIGTIVYTVVSRKKSYRTTSRFFNSSTTPRNEERHSSNHSSSDYSLDLPGLPYEP